MHEYRTYSGMDLKGLTSETERRTNGRGGNVFDITYCPLAGCWLQINLCVID